MKTALAKSILIILCTLVFVNVGIAQVNCDLQSKPAPLLLDLRIGMLPEQARAMLGRDLKIKIKKNGERTFFQNYIKKLAPEPLRGVRALYLRFFDRRLYQIEIFYEPRQDLTTLAQIREALSRQLDLPAADWQIENNRAEIACGEISLVADNVLNPRFELTDEPARRQVLAARAKDSQ